jgi:hypothetical protein
MRQRHRDAKTNDSKSPKVHRREGYLATVQMKLVIFTVLRCTSAELFSPCCDSVAAPRATAWALRSSTCDALRAAPRATAWAPRSSICATPRALAWAPRSSTCDAQRGNGLGTTVKYQRRTASGAAGKRPGHHGQVPAAHNKRLRGQRPESIPGITCVPLHHKRFTFAFFCACLLRQQAE